MIVFTDIFNGSGIVTLSPSFDEKPDKIFVYTRLQVALFYIFLIVGGLGAYLLVLLGFWRNRKIYDRQPFYKLLYHLAAGDVGMLVAQMIMLPIVFTGDPLYGMGYFHNALGAIDSLCFFAVFFTSFFIATNRFCVFTLPADNRFLNVVFDEHVRKLACLPWLLSGLIYMATSGIGCLKVFTNLGLHYTYACPEHMSPFGIAFMTYLFYVEAVVPISMFCMYVVVAFRLRQKRRQGEQAAAAASHETQRRAKRERSLLLQSVIICTVLEVECLLFFTVPGMHWGLAGGVFVNSFTIVNSAINPYIFLLFNGTMRDSVKKVLGVYRGGNRIGSQTTMSRHVMGAPRPSPRRAP